jgi:hypothetical protein
MILTETAGNLGRTNAHVDWLSRFQAIPQADQAQENSQMADIISLFPTEKSCDEAQLAAAVHNEETTIFLGLDASKEDFFLAHNLEVLPKSRHQKKPLIRALHGLGESATVIILDFEEVIKRNQIHQHSQLRWTREDLRLHVHLQHVHANLQGPRGLAPVHLGEAHGSARPRYRPRTRHRPQVHR